MLGRIRGCSRGRAFKWNDQTGQRIGVRVIEEGARRGSCTTRRRLVTAMCPKPLIDSCICGKPTLTQVNIKRKITPQECFLSRDRMPGTCLGGQRSGSIKRND